MSAHRKIRGFLAGTVMTLTVINTALANPPVPAHKPTQPVLEVSMPGDDRLDCTEISREIGHMESVVFDSDASQRAAENTGTGISIVKAIGGFLIGSVPGAIGVMAAGHVAGEAAEGKAENAEVMEDIAAQRRSLMIGMYNAKGCKGPIHSTRAVRDAAIDVDKFSPAAIEPAAGRSAKGYVLQAHKVKYND
ncbi:MAG: hypothetical protein KJ667_07050 [Alphaproteobacteria bacterium]|nr:hypothetical protein [Alphaproteobacteria bacterium]